jgi:hypothetical protein
MTIGGFRLGAPKESFTAPAAKADHKGLPAIPSTWRSPITPRQGGTNNETGSKSWNRPLDAV